MKKKQLSREKISESEPESYYFDLQASWGLTKHMGGLEATRKLIEACHIDKDSYVLDVGCGVGITACYLAAGLTGVAARVYKTSALCQWASEVRQMDPRDYLGAWRKFFSLCFKSPAVRKWIKEISVPPRSIFRIFKYFGYGIYVGGK